MNVAHNATVSLCNKNSFARLIQPRNLFLYKCIPSKSLLDVHRSHHDAYQEQDSPGRPSNRRHCAPCRHTMPKAMRYDCKPPPLGLYKEEAVPWPQWDEIIISYPHLLAYSFPLILALCLNHLAGTWRPLLLSRLACSPPLQAPLVRINTARTRKSAGRTTPRSEPG